MHACAIVLEQRLGHEGRRLAVPARNVLDDVLVHHHAVAAQNHGAEADIDLLLTTGTDFVVMELDLETRIDHGLHHLGTDIVHRIVGRNGEVSTLERRLVTQVRRLFSSTQIPATLLRVDEVVTGMLILVILNVVEDEELSFGAEEGRVGDPRRLQIRIGALGNCAWVTAIVDYKFVDFPGTWQTYEWGDLSGC